MSKVRTTVTVDQQDLEWFKKHMIKLSTFLQEKMKEIIPLSEKKPRWVK